MKILRKILLPFSLIYWFITTIRNLFYDYGLFKSFSFPLPVIVVGNLSMGGTGKSPQTEYLIRLLSDKYKVATLSRGYKRKTKGFVLADGASDPEQLGDEPSQFHRKFPHISVAVDADRVNGIGELLLLNPKPQVILLDDAYQHRRLKAGFYILLTAYNDLYTDDFLLPAGNLRESCTGAGRATIIIVTKCPMMLSFMEQESIRKRLGPAPGQEVYFTTVSYDDYVYSEDGSMAVVDARAQKKTIVAGIAKPKPFFDFVANEKDLLLEYPDHHDFSDADVRSILEKAGEGIVITTEKDYMRLTGKLPADKLYYLPIKSSFLNGGNDFDKTILDYVGQSSGNC